MEEKLQIGIVGGGNVAHHLDEAFRNKANVRLINPRTLADFPVEADLILLCVSDDAIRSVAERLPQTKALIAHTSGSVPLKEISDLYKDSGVFYPLQTFTRGVALKYDEIPVFIESNSEKGEKILREAACLFTDKIYHADSEARKKLHLASVFACNFTNALAGIAFDVLSSSGIDSKNLIPLMQQTIDKLKLMEPDKAQTGPAARGDSKVIERHISMLEDFPSYRDLYKILSDIISGKIEKSC